MPAPPRTTTASLRALLEGTIDYAGLFAPASLDMRTSVDNYSRYRNHPQQWALGRLVLPVARLDEFMNAQEDAVSEPWHLSGIVSAAIASDLAVIDEFNRKASGAVIDSVEVRACNLEEIELIRIHRPAGATVLYEITPERADELLPAPAAHEGHGGTDAMHEGDHEAHGQLRHRPSVHPAPPADA